MVWLPLFWWGFMYVIFKKSKSLQFVFTIASCIGNFILPAKFVFTYIQTTITLSHMFSLTINEKDKYYTMQAFVLLPIGFVPWIEATQCSNFLVHYGGHLWYDMSIPICLLIYFYIAKTTFEQPKKMKHKNV